MHIGFSIKLPANLTIALIERDQAKAHCRPRPRNECGRNELVHPCAQHLVVARHGCAPSQVEPAACPADAVAVNHPAQWPYDLCAAPQRPYEPHRIPPPRFTLQSPKFFPPLADVTSRHVDVLG